MSDWTTNTSASDIAAWLKDQRAVVLLTHTKPDGDALGSTLALARAINRVSESSGAASVAECWYAGPMPPWAPALMGETKCRVIEPGQPVPGALDPSAVVVCDTGAWGQIEAFTEWVRPRAGDTAIIDHHLSGNAEIGARRLLDTKAAAVCQPVAEVCLALLGLSSPTELPIEIAEPLYTGLATDTGWYRHSNVDRRVMHLAGDLLEAGVNHGRIFERIEEQDRTSRLRLMARALASLEIVKDKRLALMSLTKADFDETGAAPGDSGGFVDVARSVRDIRMTAVLTEAENNSPEGPVTKISMRSKSEPFDGEEPVDVAALLRTLGGGGHARAAGARLRMPIAEAKAKLIEALG
ncbi:MAG: exopolyphosphatase-related protein [Phycisphaeraceae bacterium]|nr:MAG: exopolyphosphatase-related protein [Phycisphaeraceae bacterium]